MDYRIRIEQFEGPLELLLALIEKDKLDITRVSLADVTDQYLEYLKREESISLEHLSSFLSVAARLILIKSKALLPILHFSDDEEEEIGDLETELRRYKLFKDAALEIGMLAFRQQTYSRESSLGNISVFLPPKNISARDMENYFRGVLGEIPSFEKLEESRVKEVITLEEKISMLQNSLQERLERSFSDIIKSTKDKVHVIVSFLALLELVKQRVIHAEQGEMFGEITFRKKTDQEEEEVSETRESQS